MEREHSRSFLHFAMHFPVSQMGLSLSVQSSSLVQGGGPASTTSTGLATHA